MFLKQFAHQKRHGLSKFEISLFPKCHDHVRIKSSCSTKASKSAEKSLHTATSGQSLLIPSELWGTSATGPSLTKGNAVNVHLYLSLLEELIGCHTISISRCSFAPHLWYWLLVKCMEASLCWNLVMALLGAIKSTSAVGDRRLPLMVRTHHIIQGLEPLISRRWG